MPQHINIDPPESFFSIGWWKKPSPWWEDGIWREESLGRSFQAANQLINSAELDDRDIRKSLLYYDADLWDPYSRTENIGEKNEIE